MKTIQWKTGIYLTVALLPVLHSCGKSDENYDASGTFETTEVIVSSEATGKILRFELEEGQQLTSEQVVGNIDSTQLYLKKMQLIASRKSLLSRRPDIRKQMAALEQQLATAKSEQKRIENLVKANASTTKQLDDVNAQIALLGKQLAATKSTLETTDEGMYNDSEALSLQIRQLEDQLEKCRIKSPVTGMVLVKYAEQGELAVAGKALFKVGDMDHMILRVYITSSQLTQIKTGQKVKVYADFGHKESRAYEGIVSWISSKSEFTPKTIQTRDERDNMVYAVKVSMQNDGYLKIGQYGNVEF